MLHYEAVLIYPQRQGTAPKFSDIDLFALKLGRESITIDKAKLC